MVALPRSLPKPKMPSVKGKVHSSTQKKPDKCVKGTSFSCGATCLPRLTKEGKRTICHMAIAGTAKVAFEWQAKQDARLHIMQSVNKDETRISEGRGRIYRDEKGNIQEEDMTSYMTGAKSIKLGQKGVKGEVVNGKFKSYTQGGKPTAEGLKMLDRVNALQSKQKQAEAIAARATHPEQKKRANLLAEKFRGQANKITDWVAKQGERLRQSLDSKRQKRAKAEPKSFPKVEELATAIAENARQLQEAVARGEQLSNTTPVAQPKAESSKSKTETKPKEKAIAASSPFKDGEIPDKVGLRQQGYDRIGAGAHGQIFQKGDQVVKYARTISESEYAIGKQAEALGIGPRVYGRNKTDSGDAMAIQFINGKTLSEFFPNNETLDGSTFDKVLPLMAEMHKAGIAHNDFHGRNIIQDGDRFKAIDFGTSTTNNQTRIIEEMLKPAFLTSYNIDNSYGTVSTPNSKLRSRYDKATQEFTKQYGEDSEKWPKGKEAEKAIANFYQKVLEDPSSKSSNPLW